ncbi:Tim44 domain-containing protein [Sphaerotilus mobilis]|uniref:Putative lipid-binding transport protein (Tim44 family) n=1 Tax=Sphaerotilus mobilis TaxID=47994 RepID=A0A4V2EWS6_9BURK|nr:TIM44-like domain-containing protein [Sphaerotilus mobilis]RZS57020.1 putative lipid-binding transport protein (Tim44 family) [Sphaerotilus mobilis]
MKQGWMAALAVAVAMGTWTVDADAAKRLGGGGSAGMQRSLPARSQPADINSAPAKPMQNQQAAPAQQAQPGVAGAAGAAAAPAKRNWMGPIAGLAAGLGIAALLSHFGMGEAVANFLMMALLAVAAVFLVTWLVRRFGAGKAQAAGKGQPAYAYAGAGTSPASTDAVSPVASAPALQREALPGSAADSFRMDGGSPAGASLAPVAANFAAPVLPADFDAAAFERIARMIFIRMQTANDRGDLDDLRQFTTAELFASIRLDLQDRGGKTQQTDVEQVAAQVIDFDRESNRDVVSVRFHGLIREEADAAATAFDEIWHLVREASAPQVWRIAGIQQAQ